MMKKGFFVIILVVVITSIVALSSVFAARYFETKVTTTNALKESPVISGSNIAWLERSADEKNNRADIFLYDSSTRETKRITEDNSFPKKMAITDNYIYWLDARSDAPGLYSADLLVGTKELISEISDFPAWADHGGNNISASANNVAYSLAGHTGIFYYDVAQKKVTNVKDVAVNGLSLFGRKIAWSDPSLGGADIHVLDIATNGVRHVTTSGLVTPLLDNVSLAENRVVWLEGELGSSSVMSYDLLTGVLETLTTAPGKYLAPKVSNEFVVWSSFNSFSGKYLLTTYNLVTKQLDHSGDDGVIDLAVAGNQVVFAGYRDGQFDIYTLDLNKAEMLKVVSAPVVEVKKFDYTPGDLLKGSATTIYYFGADGKRYSFPNTKCFLTWYPDYTKVTKLTDDKLSAIEVGGYITYRPGARIIKQEKGSKIYAVDRGGVKRLIASTDLASQIFGADWQKLVDVIPDKFWNNYTDGSDIKVATDYDRAGLLGEAWSVDMDKGLVK